MAQRYAGILLSLAIWAVSFAVYALSPVITSYDSRWSIPTAISLLNGDGGDLTDFLVTVRSKEAGQLETWQGHPHTRFPIGASLLALPAVAVAELMDAKFGEKMQEAPRFFEQNIAAFYGALAVVVFFWVVFSQFRSVPIALATTFIFGFCTSMWSTATRALWQHGPLVLMLLVAMLLLIQARRRPQLSQYAALPLAMSFVIRPTAAIPIAVLSAYMLIYYRPWFLRYLLWAAVIAVPWVAFNYDAFGAVLTPYYLPGRLGTTTFGEALLGTLLSPSRGLFVHSPVLLFAFSGAILALRNREERPLYIAFCLIVVLHWIAIARFEDWWGGHSLGPRYMTDVLPFLCFFVAFNFQLLTSMRFWPAASMTALVVFLSAASLFIHARAAWSWGPVEWNAVPINVNHDRARLWDWRDPQFLRHSDPRLAAAAAANASLPSTVIPTPLSTLLAFHDNGDGRPLLGPGWSAPEEWGVWSDGPEASLQLLLNKPSSSLQLRLLAQGFGPEAGQKQTVTVLFHDRKVARLELGPTPEWFNIALPLSEFADGEHVYALEFLVGRPTSPAQRRLSSDPRLLGIGLLQAILQEP